MAQQLDARARRSRDVLMRAGLELLNVNKDASLSDIASRAGVGRTTLYRQYETREKLISAIAVYCLETIDEVTAPIEKEAKTVTQAIHRLFQLAMPLTQEFQFLMNLDQLVEDDPDIKAIHEKQHREMVELVEYGKKNGEISQKLPTSWVINLIEGLFYIGWLEQEKGNRTAAEVAEFAFESFKNGVGN